MKNSLYALLLAVLFSIPAYADSTTVEPTAQIPVTTAILEDAFNNGQNKNGLYCLETSARCETVYSKDASLLLSENSAGKGNVSSAWYMRKRLDSKLNKPTPKFWNRISTMNRILKK